MPKRSIASVKLSRRIGVHVVADQLPQRGDDALGQRDHVVLVDEAHLDVELGELGLAVRAVVLVAVAPGDLEVTLEAGDHEQLLEQLWRLRQRVPRPGMQPRRNQEVAHLGRRPGQRRSLDLDESLGQEEVARRLADLRPQAESRGRSGAAQVEYRCRSRTSSPTEATDPVSSTWNGSGAASLRTSTMSATTSTSPVGLGFSFPAGRRRTGPSTRTQYSVQPGGDRLLVHDDLDDARTVAQIEEGDPAVVAPPCHPAREHDGAVGVFGAQVAGRLVTQHEHWSFGGWRSRPDPTDRRHPPSNGLRLRAG